MMIRLYGSTFYVDGWVDFAGEKHWGERACKPVHPRKSCEKRGYCVIHNPSIHHMFEWPLIWNQQEQQMERLCEHNLAHPDPDDLRYWLEVAKQPWKQEHACDGCCLEEDL